MKTKEKSAEPSSGQAFSGDEGLVVPKEDRTPSGAGAQANVILECAAHAELRMVLDGEAQRRLKGFDASTDERVLYVPYAKAMDAAQAILLCRQGGVLRDKLARMDDAIAAVVYATTLASPKLEN